MSNKISAFRQPMMGFAICAILFIHLFFIGILDERYGIWWQKLRQMGSGGVDVFLLLSAFGLCFSLKHNPSATQFYKKRLLRLLPAIVIGFFLANYLVVYNEFTTNSSYGLALQNCWMYFRYYVYSLWFIFLILLLYLVFPIAYTFMSDAKDRQALVSRGRNLFAVAVAVAFLMIYCVGDFGIVDMYGTIMLSLYRVPVFFVGIFIFYELPATKYIYHSHWAFAVSLTVAYLTSLYWPGMQYVAFGFLALSSLKYLIGLFDHLPVLNRIFSWIGRYTLELYVMHMCVYTHICEYMPSGTVQTLMAAVGLSFVGAIVLHYLIQVLTRPFNLKKSR